MKNPTWSRDELIVALDFYLKYRRQIPNKGDREIRELSDRLSTLGRILFGAPDTDTTFRNPNGVYMKMMNFRALDPNYTEGGKRGLTRGSKGDADVWEEFSDDPVRCEKTANAIIGSILSGATESVAASNSDDDDDVDAPEGRVLSRMHRTRERSRKLVKKKLAESIKVSGSLACQVCGFDFRLHYGEIGEGFAECHHLRPVSSLGDGHRTRLEDLAIVCANCHRMIHRRRPWLSLQELRESLNNSR